MQASTTQFLLQFPRANLFTVIGIGYLLGQVSLAGFRLGVAGVLFAGLAVGMLTEIALPPMRSAAPHFREAGLLREFCARVQREHELLCGRAEYL